MKKTILIPTLILSTSFITANAATVFVTNDSGNAAALDGAAETDPLTTTDLTLSAEDGGGTITLTTLEVNREGSGGFALGMNANSLGVIGAAFGTVNQQWLFSFDQDIDFDALDFIGFDVSNVMSISSSAWVGDADATGSNWDFVGSTGIFTLNGSAASETFDFASAGVSSIAAGTPILINHESGFGGTGMTSFTISPIPEPSACGLIGLSGLALLLRRRRS